MARVTTRWSPFTTTPVLGTITYPDDIDTRNTEMESRMSEIDSIGQEIDDVGLEVNANADQVAIDKTDAAASALLASGFANYKGEWNSEDATAGLYDIGVSVKDPTSGVNYVSEVDNNTSSDFSDSAFWRLGTINALAIGNINNPLLDLPFKNSLAPKQGVGSVTSTRASTAAYRDRYRELKTAAIDEARFEKEGLLIEGASTNLLTYSNDFTNAVWSKANTIIDSAATTSPDTTTNASKLKEDTATSQHYLNRNISVTAGEEYTLYIFAKASEYTTFDMWFSSSGFGATLRTRFDLVNGVATTVEGGLAGEMVEFRDGWWLCKATVTATATTSTSTSLFLNNAASYTGDGTSGIYIFGAQFENLPFATSYISTAATAVTRSADDCGVQYDNNTPNWNDNFSLLFDYNLLSEDTYSENRVGVSIDGISTQVMTVKAADTNLMKGYNGAAGVLTVEATAPQVARAAFTYDGVTSSLYLDGVLQDTGVPSVSTGTVVRIGLGNRNGAQIIYGHMNNLRIYDRALTAEEIAIA